MPKFFGYRSIAVEGDTVWALETMGKNVYQFKPDGTIARTLHLGDAVDFPVSLALGPTDSSIYDTSGTFSTPMRALLSSFNLVVMW